MRRLSVILAGLLVTAFTFVGCAGTSFDAGWVTLIDGEKGLENFDRLGGANWRAEGGAIVADRSPDTSYLVTRRSYKDFVIRAEFWADPRTNSGIFIRAQNAKKIGADSSYEVNIYDARPGQEYATGGIVNFAKIPVPNPPGYKAANKWNTFEITARGSVVTVLLNGQKTVEMNNGKFPEGPFALQFGNHGKEPGGVIKWRKVQVRSL
jgi:3-keto-disaccharide hydrolase